MTKSKSSDGWYHGRTQSAEKTMNIDKIRKQRSDLEIQITDMLRRFEESTKVSIVDLDLIFHKTPQGKLDIAMVSIETDIGRAPED